MSAVLAIVLQRKQNLAALASMYLALEHYVFGVMENDPPTRSSGTK
nr:hypothetical protein [Acetobacter nitrogenifigens]